MSTATTLQLPDILREHQDEIAAALAHPSLRSWVEGMKLAHAPQAEAIGNVLVEAIHTDLVNAKIGYLFREKMEKRDRTVLGQASKASGKVAFYSELDLLIELNWTRWVFADSRDKLALIDHELSHFGREEDEKGRTKYVLISHDVEEFNGIVRRWGFWKSDLKHFARTIGEVQRDLFHSGELAADD